MKSKSPRNSSSLLQSSSLHDHKSYGDAAKKKTDLHYQYCYPSTPATERDEHADDPNIINNNSNNNNNNNDTTCTTTTDLLVTSTRSLHALVSPPGSTANRKKLTMSRDFFLRHRQSPSIIRRRKRLDAVDAKEAVRAAIDPVNNNIRQGGKSHGPPPPPPPLLTEEELQSKKAQALKGIRKLLQAQKDKEQAEKRRLLDFLRQHDPSHHQNHHHHHPPSQQGGGGGVRRKSAAAGGGGGDGPHHHHQRQQHHPMSATRTIDTLEEDEEDLLSIASAAGYNSDDAAVVRRVASSDEEDEDGDNDNDDNHINEREQEEAVMMDPTKVDVDGIMPDNRRTPRQRALAEQAHKTLRGINMKHRLNLLRQTAHQALAKHAARQALKRELKLAQQQQQLKSVGGGAAPPHHNNKSNTIHHPDRLLLMKQAVKDALLRSSSHQNMGMVAQELLASAARKNFKKQAVLTLQRVARGFLVRQRLRRAG